MAGQPSSKAAIVISILSLVASLAVVYLTWLRPPALTIHIGPDILVRNRVSNKPSARILMALENSGARYSTLTVIECVLKVTRANPSKEMRLMWAEDLLEGRRLHPLPIRADAAVGMEVLFSVGDARNIERKSDNTWYEEVKRRLPEMAKRIDRSRGVIDSLDGLSFGGRGPADGAGGTADISGMREYAEAERALGVLLINLNDREGLVFFAAGRYEVELTAVGVGRKELARVRSGFEIDETTSRELTSDPFRWIRLDLETPVARQGAKGGP